MKSPIVFRAEFQQPKGAIKLASRIAVEVYQSRVGDKVSPGEWKARRPGTRIEFANITPQSTPLTIMRQIPLLNFETQLTEWEAFDSLQNGRLLLFDDWQYDPKGLPYLTESYKEKLKQEETARVEAGIRERKEKALSHGVPPER